MEDDRPTANKTDEEENEEDALPDWRQFAKFAKSHSSEYSISLAPTPTIPKRGEKDFEPVPSSSSSSSFQQSTRDATLSAHQLSTLQDSRTALFTAISSGSRHHSSKSYNSFTWRPNLDGGRATCDHGSSVFGIQFSSLGTYHLGRKRLELRPEEALYMLEKGQLELWRESKLNESEVGGENSAEGNEEEIREGMIPMTVQQGWAELLGHDELTLERFEVYTYLKRMGYVVIRSRVPPPIPTAIRHIPFYKRSILSLIRQPFISFHQLFSKVFVSLGMLLMPKKVRLGITRLLKVGEGSLVSLASGRRWTTYEQIFKRLQIIPTGSSTPLPRLATPQTPSLLNPIISSTASVITPNLPDLSTNPYQVFFHLYKPSTKFKKSAPSEPDFRLVIINTTTTPLLNVFESDYLFSTQPLLPPTKPRGPWIRPVQVTFTPAAPVAPSRFAPRVTKPLPPPVPTLLQSFLSYIPFLPTSFSTPTSTASPNSGGQKKFIPPKEGTKDYRKHSKSLYPSLKKGIKNVLVAVVENGTISTMLVTQSEFGKHVWMGGARDA